MSVEYAITIDALITFDEARHAEIEQAARRAGTSVELYIKDEPSLYWSQVEGGGEVTEVVKL